MANWGLGNVFWACVEEGHPRTASVARGREEDHSHTASVARGREEGHPRMASVARDQEEEHPRMAFVARGREEDHPRMASVARGREENHPRTASGEICNLVGSCKGRKKGVSRMAFEEGTGRIGFYRDQGVGCWDSTVLDVGSMVLAVGLV